MPFTANMWIACWNLLTSFAKKLYRRCLTGFYIPSLVKQKDGSQNGGNNKTKHAKFSAKSSLSYPLIRKSTLMHTRTYAYQGVRNVRFPGTFGMFCFVVTSVLRFALLPYYASTQLSKSIPNNGSCIHFWITAKWINSNYGPKFLCCVGVRNAEIKHKHYYPFTAFLFR